MTDIPTFSNTSHTTPMMDPIVHDTSKPYRAASSLRAEEGSGISGYAATQRLQNLPNELLGHIFQYIDSSPPSKVNASQRPSRELTSSPNHPIKSLSETSRHLRSLLLPHLFRHARLDPHYLTDFLAFLETASLAKYIVTLTVTLNEPCVPTEPCINTHPAWWARVLNDIPLISLTIVAAPQHFASLTGTRVDDSHSWAFDMPYHTLTLTQPLYATKLQIPYTELPLLLSARPWESMSYNEGSSLRAYATYEYFLKQTPCLLSSFPGHSSTHEFLSNLTSFAFVAIFPFYNHVDEVLKCVRKMGRLRALSIKLCPGPSSSVLAEEIEAINNHIDVNDPWNELETAYSLVVHTVNFLTLSGDLERLEIDDVRVDGIRDSIEGKINGHLHNRWTYESKGLWRRTDVDDR